MLLADNCSTAAWSSGFITGRVSLVSCTGRLLSVYMVPPTMLLCAIGITVSYYVHSETPSRELCFIFRICLHKGVQEEISYVCAEITSSSGIFVSLRVSTRYLICTIRVHVLGLIWIV